MAGRRHDPHTCKEFAFSFAASGSQSIVHNFGIVEDADGHWPVEIFPTYGHFDVTIINKDGFTCNVDTAPAKGIFRVYLGQDFDEEYDAI